MNVKQREGKVGGKQKDTEGERNVQMMWKRRTARDSWKWGGRWCRKDCKILGGTWVQKNHEDLGQGKKKIPASCNAGA